MGDLSPDHRLFPWTDVFLFPVVPFRFWSEREVFLDFDTIVLVVTFVLGWSEVRLPGIGF